MVAKPCPVCKSRNILIKYNKIEWNKINKEMLKELGNKILGTGITTDEQINYYGWGNPKKNWNLL